MLTRPKILVVGSLVMDLIVSTHTFPHSGETVLGKAFQSAPGGKGANQAIQAARLSADVTMVGKVGDDIWGHALLQSMKDAGVHAEHIKMEKNCTSAIGNILLEPDGQGGTKNRIIVVPGANARVSVRDIAFLEKEISQYDLLMLQLEIPMEVNIRAAQYAHAAGVPVMLNPAPAAALPAELLSCITYISPNEHEAALLTGSFLHVDEENGFQEKDLLHTATSLCAQGADNVIITLGSKGSALYTEEGIFYAPCVKIPEVKDPTAAGDSFIGAFCTAICHGMHYKHAMEFANHAAALTVSRMGAQPSLPTFQEVLTLMRKTGAETLNSEVLQKW